MNPDQTTTRQTDSSLLLVPGAFSLVLLLGLPVVRVLAQTGRVNPAFLLLLSAPWLLGALVLVTDRRAPFQFWLAPFLLALIVPMVVLWHDWSLIARWRQTGTMPHGFVTLLVNLMVVGWFTLFLRHMLPRRCPGCGRRSLVPLRKLWGTPARSARTRWCGGCGDLYYRSAAGPWLSERRSTWLEEHNQDRPEAGESD